MTNKSNTSMSATFKRSVEVQRYDVYVVLGVMEQREDIARFLRSEYQNLSEHLKSRINSHLIDLGLLDQFKNLTSDGVALRRDGMLLREEEGKYRLWCVLNDRLLGPMLVHFERDRPHARDDGAGMAVLPLDKLIGTEHDTMTIKGASSTAVHILALGSGGDGGIRGNAQGRDQVNLTWRTRILHPIPHELISL